MLPTSGLANNSSKKNSLKTKAFQIKDSLISIAVMSFLMIYKEDYTPDFFHFVVNLGEESCHYIWIMFLWLAYKAFLLGKTGSSMNLNLRLVEAIVTGILGLIFAGELGIKSLFIFATMVTILHFR